MNNKIMWRVLLPVVCLLSTVILAGCGSKEEQKEADTKAMGRYLESDITLPENMQWVYDIEQMEDGNIYMSAMDGDSAYAVWKLGEDEASWEKAYDIPAEELRDGKYGSFEIFDVTLSPYGDALIFGAMSNSEDETGQDYIEKCYHMDESGTMTDISYEAETYSYHPHCADDGSFYVNEGDFSVRKLDAETGKTEIVVDSETESYAYGTAGETLYSVSREGLVTAYDMAAKKPLPRDEGLNEAIKQSGIVTSSFSTTSLPILFASGKDENTMFFCGSTGLFRHTKNGSVTERVIDGSINSLSNPDLGLVDMEIVSDNETEAEAVYILAVSDTNNQYSLMKCGYSADTPTVPEQEIKISTLYENGDLRQAISLYQKENPNVYIKLDIAIQDQESVTVSDALRTLATEIMAGSGADLLLLDGMPLDSYIEKGVLEDISGILQEVDDKEGLFTNITSCFAKDGKTYAVPLRFNIPVVQGVKESLANVKDLKTLADEAERRHRDNPDYPVVNKELDGYSMAALLYDSCSGGWLKEDGTIDEVLLLDFYTQLQRIYSLDQRDGEADEFGYDSQTYRSVGGGTLQMYCEKSSINFGCITGFEDLTQLATAEADKENIIYDTFGGQIKDTYLPSCIAGINSMGKNTETARDFLKYMLSKNPQTTNQGGGMPVNKAGTEVLLKSEGLVNNRFGTGTAGEPDAYFEMTLKKLTEEACESYQEKVETLEHPGLSNAIIREAVLEQAGTCLTGAVTAEEAVKHVVEKVNLYLAEG